MTTQTIEAVCVDGPDQVSLRTLPMPALTAGDVLIQTSYVGICATDFKIIAGLVSRLRYPIIPGHEWSGIVAAAGSKADQHLVGQRVVAENFLTCGHCAACRQGHWNECPEAREVGFELPGGYSSYFVTRASLVRVLPDSVGLREACMIEPTAVATYAVERSNVRVGDRAVIFGDGPIGLLCLQLVCLHGAQEIIVVGGDEARLNVARSLGADITINFLQEENVTAAIKKHHPTTDVAIEASGSLKALHDAFGVLGFGGRLSIVSSYTEHDFHLDPLSIVQRNLTIVGSVASPGTWDTAIALVAARRVKIAPLVSAVYPIADWAAALDAARTHKDGAVKVALSFGNEAVR